MIDDLKKLKAKPAYTEYPKVGHNSWGKVYGTKELYTWLLEQKKNKRSFPSSLVLCPSSFVAISVRIALSPVTNDAGPSTRDIKPQRK